MEEAFMFDGGLVRYTRRGRIASNFAKAVGTALGMIFVVVAMWFILISAAVMSPK